METENGAQRVRRHGRSIAGAANGPRPVLVPLDGSPASASVLPIARAAAKLWGAPIQVLHVADSVLSCEDLLTRSRLDPRDLPGLVLDCVAGIPSEAILQTAVARNASLIVMSARGWTGDMTKALGHVSEEVLHSARCPVLLVGSNARAIDASLERLLIPLDGAPDSAAALRAIAPLAIHAGALLEVLHVVTPGKSRPAGGGALSVPRYVDQPQHEWGVWRKEFSRRFLRSIGGNLGNVEVAVGNPGEEVVRAAQQHNSNLIVLAWHGSAEPGRAETVRTVLRDAPCPVLLIRTDRRRQSTEGASLDT